MRLPDVQQLVSRWPEGAIGDTVAAIVQQSRYQRSLTETLWQRLMRALGQLFRELFELFAGSGPGRVVVIALFTVLVLLVLARLFIGYRSARELAGGRRLPRRTRDGVDHLRRAEQLASRGDYTGAAHALFAGLLEACAARGEVRLHSSKTTGDYAREMRRRGTQSAAGFQDFRASYDPVVYRHAIVTESDYRALAGAAVPLIGPERAA